MHGFHANLCSRGEKREKKERSLARGSDVGIKKMSATKVKMVGWFLGEERRGEDVDRERPERLRFHVLKVTRFAILITDISLRIYYYVYSILQNLTSYTCEKIKLNSKYTCSYNVVDNLSNISINFQVGFR